MKTIVFTEPLHASSDIWNKDKKQLEDWGFSVISYTGRPSSQEELGERLAPADIAVIANYPLTGIALQKADHLSYVCVAFSGVDHVDLSYCKDHHISVSNCAGYSTESVAELVFGQMISLLRHLKEEDAAARNQFHASLPRGEELSGKTIGIIGTGRIGSQVALIAKAFGCHVIGWNRSHNNSAISYVDFDTLLRTSDIISIHVPLTDETRNLIGIKELRKMKKTSLLINTARGPIVNGKELAEALQQEIISGAAIDVFDKEPPLENENPLLHAPHIILTPHIGFDTQEAMNRRMAIVMENLSAYTKGIIKNSAF